MQIVTCWRCEQPGHPAAECQPPAAKTETELRERFNRYIELVRANRISLVTKRKWVTAEWAMYHDAKAKAKERK